MAEIPHEAPLRVRRWVIAALVIFAMLGISFGTWMSRLPSIRDQLNASTFDMSIYGLCLASGSLAGLIFSGRVVSRIGPRRSLLIGMLAQAVTLVAAVALFWIDLVGAGMLMLFCYGFAFGICDVAANVSGTGAERELGLPRLPLFHGAYSLGGVVAMGMGSVAEATRFPVPIHAAIILSLMAIATVVALRWIPRDQAVMRAATRTVVDVPVESAADEDPAEQPGSVLTGPIPTVGESPAAAPMRAYNPWRDPRIYIIGLMALTMSLAEGVGSDWIALALIDGRGLSNGTATLMVGVLLVSMLTSRALGAPLLTRFSRVAVVRTSAIVCGLGVVILILVSAPWAPVVGTVLWGLGGGLGFPVAISASADDPEKAVKSVAAVSAIAYGAFLIGPVMIGFLGEHIGLLDAFWPMVAFMAVCAVLAGALRERTP